MASAVLRQAVYGLFVASPALKVLGYEEGTILPNFSPDGPTQDRFMVLRWAATAVGIGGVNRVRLAVWVYNRKPDFMPIAEAIKELRRLVPTLVATRLASGESVVDAKWEGDTDDAYDDGYRAHTRSTEYTITASGS